MNFALLNCIVKQGHLKLEKQSGTYILGAGARGSHRAIVTWPLSGNDEGGPNTAGGRGGYPENKSNPTPTRGPRFGGWDLA